MKTLVIAVGTAVLLVAVTAGAQAQVPTFNKDVAPILYAKCASCHRPGEIAPMSLLSYKDARPWARGIRAKVVAREMPPWFAEIETPHKVQDVNVLTQAQIDVLAKWADGGAPEGTGPAPEPPKFLASVSAAMNRPPDYVLQTGDIDIPASGQIPNITVWTKTPFTDSQAFFEATEMRPTNRAVTHHAGTFALALPRGSSIGRGPAWKGGPEIDGVLINADGSLPDDASSASEFPETTTSPAFTDSGPRRPRGATHNGIIGHYAPAGGFLKYPQDMVKRIGPENPYMNWLLHYTVTGKPEKVRMDLMLWKSDPAKAKYEAVGSLMTDVEIVNGRELFQRERRPNIPPFKDDYKVVSMTGFDSPVSILNFWPHMHLRGKSMKFVAAFPDGHEETLLNVQRYEFDWQLFYMLEKPAKLPAGTIVRAEVVYDNSIKNKLNPSPEKEVPWGSMSWDEMHFPFLEFVLDNDVQPWANRRRTGTN
jgi:hypothetical protein